MTPSLDWFENATPGRHGLFRTAVVVPRVRPMNVKFNVWEMVCRARHLEKRGVQLGVFPELCITGYTCRDAFQQRTLQRAALKGLAAFAKQAKYLNGVFVIGLPLPLDGMLANAAAIVHRGEVLGFVPKSLIPNYGPFEELRWFHPAGDFKSTEVIFQGKAVPFGTDILVEVTTASGETVTVGAEVCEDGWHRRSPSGKQAVNGAIISVNLSASNFIVAKDDYRHMIFGALSGDIIGAYLYASCGYGESTADVVFDGDAFIAENGNLVGRSKRWSRKGDIVVADIDVQRLKREREVTTPFGTLVGQDASRFRIVRAMVNDLAIEPRSTHAPPKLEVIQGGRNRVWTHGDPSSTDAKAMHRPITRKPFVPRDPSTLDKRCEDIIEASMQGLMVRLESMSRRKTARMLLADPATLDAPWETPEELPPIDVAYGDSGGRDSRLTGEILIRIYDRFGWSRKHIHAVRMPGPGSSDNTQSLSLRRCELAGVTVHTVPIEELAATLLKNAGHEPCWNCAQCENAQARARTTQLMTIGFVVGTGDLTEGALGWCTYNGDHMSMYNPNCGIPKTLVEHLLRWIRNNWLSPEEQEVMDGILAEIISPELIKVKPGEPIQSTEEKVGPMELNDFFIYYMLRHGKEPGEIADLAEIAFSRPEDEGDKIYDRATILKWLRKFYVRFQDAQFKRDAVPNGPLIGSVGLSPRGNLRWPADGIIDLWTDEVDELMLAIAA